MKLQQNNQTNLMPSPLSLAIFFGLVLIILIYTAIGKTNIINEHNKILFYQPLFLILGLMLAIHENLLIFQKKRFQNGISDPLFARTLMRRSIQKTCENIESKLNCPYSSCQEIFTIMLQDKIINIRESDCRRFPKITKAINQNTLLKVTGLKLENFFATKEDYKNTPLPDEIYLISHAVNKNRKELKKQLKTLKLTYCNLVTFLGNYLTLWHIENEKIDSIARIYRYRPPYREQTQRMVFAIKTASFLSKLKNNQLNSEDFEKYKIMAEKTIFRLTIAIEAYKNAWKRLVDQY